MRLFYISMIVVFADAHHQLRVRVAAVSEKKIEQCISKQAYFDREKNRLIILSVSEKCDKQFMDVIQYAKTIPEELRVHIINTVKDYEEEMLRRSHELCKVSIAEDVNEEIVKWLLIDCNESKRKSSTRSRIRWFIISIITAVTVTIVIIVGLHCYYIKRKKQIKQKQQERQQQHLQPQQQGQQMSLNTSSEKLSEITDHTTLTRALTAQTTSSSDLNLIQSRTKTEARMKQDGREEISERINRQADEEFQQEKKELKAFYKQVRQHFPEKTERTQQRSEKSHEENYWSH